VTFVGSLKSQEPYRMGDAKFRPREKDLLQKKNRDSSSCCWRCTSKEVFIRFGTNICFVKLIVGFVTLISILIRYVPREINHVKRLLLRYRHFAFYNLNNVNGLFFKLRVNLNDLNIFY